MGARNDTEMQEFDSVDTFRDSLNQDGYAVARDVVTAKECEAWVDEIKADGAACHAHSDFMWKVREDARVRRVFATAWGVDAAASLCTGFDGLGVREPGEKGLVLDWHVDQGPMHPPGRSCLQGLLCLTDVDETTGGTAFVVGSHVHHPDLCTRVATDEDWVEGVWEFMDVPRSDVLLRTQCPERAQPSVSAGSMIVWDSRTVHRVVPPTDPSTRRVVVYLSMMPRDRIPDEVISRRREYYSSGIATTHWPSPCVDRGEGRVPPSVPFEAASDVRRSLIG